MASLKSIKDSSLLELAKIVGSWGEPTFRAQQVFSWIFRKNARNFENMTDLNRALRVRLSEEFLLDDPIEERRLRSLDGTLKFALRLKDGNLIESVIISDEKRRTLCVSTQVGCRRGCRICATASMGFKRNLTSGEILNQIIHANRILLPDLRLTHIVFMGMGEPMDNLDQVLKSLNVIHDDYGFCIGAHRVTVSTVGILEGIERLAREAKGEGLAVSLHASNDRIREKIVPIARKTAIHDILEAARSYGRKFGEKVTFEYVLIKGLNCLPEHGREIAALLTKLPCKLNLIPCNPAGNPAYQPPSESEIREFLKPILRTDIIVTRRKTKGNDIAAACGQLVA